MIVNNANRGDNGKYLCKASNRAGANELLHVVSFASKAEHIADNAHGIYHADVGLLARAKSEVRSGTLNRNANTNTNADADAENDGEIEGKEVDDAPASPSHTRYVPSASKRGPRDARLAIHFSTNLTNRVVAEGSKVRLTCCLEGADPLIRWTKDNQPVVFGTKVRNASQNGLCVVELTSASVGDSGIYKCWARNESGEAETSGKLEIYPVAKSSDLTPTFTRALNDVYHSHFNEISLTCRVRGTPRPKITWWKDAVRITRNEKYRTVELDDGTCELIVSDVTRQDSGKYVCEAESRAGSAKMLHLVQAQTRGQNDLFLTPRKNTKLKKIQQPTEEETSGGDSGRPRCVPLPPDPKNQLFFAAFLSDRTVCEGGKTKLSCFVQGPDPYVKWFRNDEPVVFSSKCRGEMREGLCSLTFTNLAQEDSGNYRITVRNQYNEISSTCCLKVYERIKQVGAAPIFATTIKGVFRAFN